MAAAAEEDGVSEALLALASLVPKLLSVSVEEAAELVSVPEDDVPSATPEFPVAEDEALPEAVPCPEVAISTLR